MEYLKLTQGFARFLMCSVVCAVLYIAVGPASVLAAGPVVSIVGDMTLTTDLTEALKIIFSDPLVNNIVG